MKKNILKASIAASAAIALAVLSGCGPIEDASASSTSTTTSTTYTPPSTSAVAAPAAEPEGMSPEAEQAIRQNPAFQAEVMGKVLANEGIYMPEGMIGEYAQIVCEGLADGMHPMMLHTVSMNNFPNWDSMEHATLIGASVGSHCPELGYIIDAAG